MKRNTFFIIAAIFLLVGVLMIIGLLQFLPVACIGVTIPFSNICAGFSLNYNFFGGIILLPFGAFVYLRGRKARR